MAKSGVTLDYPKEYGDESSMYSEHFAALDRIQSKKDSTSKLLPFESQILAAVKSDTRAGRFVDIGCGTGRLLRAVESAGVSAVGYEIVPEICSRLARYGRTVRQGGYEEFLVSPDRADSVALLEVLEHLPDPKGAVQSILSVKKPRYLFVVVPDFRVRRIFDTHFREHDIPPNHLTWWNAQALRAVMRHPNYSVQVTPIRELRRSLARNVIRGDIISAGASPLAWFWSMLRPPSFWFLGVACRH